MVQLSIIRQLVESKGMSLRQMCVKAGISEQSIQKIFRQNTCSLKTLEKISLALGVSPTIFFDDKDENTPSENDIFSNGGGNEVNSGDIIIPQEVLQMLNDKDKALLEKDKTIKELISMTKSIIEHYSTQDTE